LLPWAVPTIYRNTAIAEVASVHAGIVNASALGRRSLSEQIFGFQNDA
jgi:hypothetical protein